MDVQNVDLGSQQIVQESAAVMVESRAIDQAQEGDAVASAPPVSDPNLGTQVDLLD